VAPAKRSRNKLSRKLPAWRQRLGGLGNALPKPALGLMAANPAAQATPAQDSSSKRKRPLVGTTGPRFSAQGALTDVDSASEVLVIQQQNERGGWRPPALSGIPFLTQH
jgi:hypothetical protein